MSAGRDLERRIAEAYRWQRRLGARTITAPHCRIVVDPDRPRVWDRNHADDVSASAPAEIDAVFAAMDEHLAHSDWRVVHTDGFTPEAFLARLAFEDFAERPPTIQMALENATVAAGRPIALDLVENEADWATLAELVRRNHTEGRATGGLELSDAVSAGLVEGYRSKDPLFRFHLVRDAGVAIAYGAAAAAPNGLGMIEDLFTLPAHRRRGVASAMIATLVARLRADGCDGVFLGALAEEAPKWLYRRLGFAPVALARAWVKSVR
jgi:ribosomal protein S18 acetylase RimI-like enzyme